MRRGRCQSCVGRQWCLTVLLYSCRDLCRSHAKLELSQEFFEIFELFSLNGKDDRTERDCYSISPIGSQ